MLPEGHHLQGKYVIVHYDNKPIPAANREIVDDISIPIDMKFHIINSYETDSGLIHEVMIYHPDSPRVNVKNALKVVDGYTRWILYEKGLLPKHIKEQLDYRFKVCKPCLDNNSCIVCGCKAPQRLCTDGPCAGGRYPALMDETAWKIYKTNELQQTEDNGDNIQHSGESSPDNPGRVVNTRVQKNMGVRQRSSKSKSNV